MNQSLNRFFFAVMRGVWDLGTGKLNYHAAAVTFFFLMTLIPLITVFTAIIAWLPIDRHAILEIVTIIVPYMPYDLKSFVNPSTASGWVFGVIGFCLAYYFSMTLFLEFKTSLGYALKIENINKHRSFLTRFFAVPVLVIFILGMALISISINVALDQLLPAARGAVFAVLGCEIFIKDIFSDSIFIIVFGGFNALFYYLMVPGDAFRKWHVVGVVVTNIFFFLLLKGGFQFYFNTVFRSNPVYGPVMGILVFLIWIYYSVLILLTGARILYFLGDVKEAASNAKE